VAVEAGDQFLVRGGKNIEAIEQRPHPC
jgi:hypothetical protein